MEIAFKHKTFECITPALLETSVQSFVLSKKYVHAMLKASLFNILYRRLPVNEKELVQKRYEDIPFVVHKSDDRHGVHDRWFKNFCYCLPAIEDTINKNYLKTLYVFMKNSKNKILETYRFDLKYNTDSTFSYKTEDKKTPKEVSIATKALFTSILKLGSVDKLGTDTNLEIELLLTDDCPENYKPPKFQATNEPLHEKIQYFDILGEIKTGFLKLSSRSSGVKEKLRKAMVDKDKKTTDIDITTKTDYDAANSTAKNSKRKVEVLNLKKDEESTRKKFDNSDITVSDREETYTVSDNSKDDTDISCICKLQAPDDVQIIRCNSCRQPFHAVCFGYFTEDPSIIFTCNDCNMKDEPLKSSKKRKTHLTAKLRLILVCIMKTGQIPKEIINSISEVDEKEVFERMRSLKLCEPDSKSLSKCVIRWSQIEAYLNMLQNDVEDSQYLLSSKSMFSSILD